MQRRTILQSILALSGVVSMPTFAAPLTGKIMGTAVVHTQESMSRAIQAGWVVLPASLTGNQLYEGKLSNAPQTKGKAASLIFVHGSGGLNDNIKAFQRWLADKLNIASFTLDSFQLPDRMTYSSPIPKKDYEKIHSLRSSELSAAVDWLTTAPWFDGRFVIAGTSEGAVAVARYTRAAAAPAERGRIIFSWSCEDNYHVEAHKTNIPDDLPVLNVMSATDKYFSKANSYLGNDAAVGHCANVLAKNTAASIVLIPGAPHTLMNVPQAREAVEGFLRDRLLK